MTFTEACAYVLDFGKKYRGQTVTRVGNNDEGLRYLDWCIGQEFLNYDRYAETREAIEIYLKHPAVAMRVNQLVDDD